MAFDRWHQQLLTVLHAVKRKQHQYDQATHACQVLLKPWPKKAQDEKAASKQVNPQEEAELKLVNDLLSKAQKTRDVTSSKKAEKDRKPTNHVEASSRTEKALWEVCESDQKTPSPASEKKVLPSGDQVQGPEVKTCKNLLHANYSGHPTRSVQSMHRKQRQKSHQATVTDAPGKNNLSVSSLMKSNSVADAKHQKSRECLESAQPHFRPASGVRKTKPAHVTAPFKTDPSLHRPKRPVKKNLHPVSQQRPRKDHTQFGDSSHHNKILPPIALETDPPSVTDNVSPINDVCDVQSTFSLEELHVTDTDDASCVNPEDSLTGSEMINTGISDSEISNQKTEDNDKESKLFSLSLDGPNPNIQPRMRRTFTKNQQLRNKMLQQRTGRKLKSVDHDLGQKFADKLTQLFDTEEEMLYRQQALECLHTHCQLVQLLKQLDLDQLSDNSSAKEVLRAKLMAEFVLTSFSSYSEDVNLLSKGDSNPVQFPETPEVPQPSYSPLEQCHVWLPPDIQGQSNGFSISTLQYTSKADLRNYADLLLKVQILQCQQHLLNILMSDVLPWIAGLDSNDRDFGAVFRGLFSLLTSDGSYLPVLVQDSLD